MTVEIDKPQENCGGMVLLDISGKESVRRGVIVLNKVQHRGYDSAGIATVNHGFHSHKSLGTIKQIFTEEVIQQQNLEGSLVVGHTRYKIQGGDTLAYTQPIIATYEDRTIALAHNGNIPDITAMREKLAKRGITANPEFDSNILANLIVSADGDNWIERIQNGLQGVEGSYALFMATNDNHMLVARDPWGNRPLSIARINSGYVAASETVGFQVIRARDWYEVEPGEIIDFSAEGIYKSSLLEEAQARKCSFEQIYFAYETSVTEGETNANFRKRLGIKLALNHPGNGDVVAEIPKSACVAADSYAHAIGKPSEKLIIKDDEFIGRAFMGGEMGERSKKVEAKYDISPDIEGKFIDQIDDSIVCGITLENLNGTLRNDYNVAEIHTRIPSPKVIRDCPWGVNMRSSDGKFAALDEVTGEVLPNKEIAKKIGADTLEYLTLEELKEVEAEGGRNPEEYCHFCFGGEGMKSAVLKQTRPVIEKFDFGN